MATVGLEKMETSTLRLQNIITQYIVTPKILAIFILKQRHTGPWVKQHWWEQGGVYLYLEVVRVAERETEDFIEAGEDTEAEEQR